MLLVDTLRSKSVGGVELGHLVVIFTVLGEYQFAIRVEAPDNYKGKPTVLALETLHVEVHDDFCLDFGIAPTYVWDHLQVAHLIRDKRPAAGPLAVLNECAAIRGTYDVPPYDHPIGCWDIATGKMVKRTDGAIFIREWELGVRDLAEQFVLLHTFPSPRPSSSP